MDIKFGKYKIKGKHKDCKYNGKVMECSLHYINGKPNPSNTKIEWLWCNGYIWNGEKQLHERCSVSNRINGKVKVEIE